MLDQLDRLAYTFANIFNEIHASGYDMDGEQGTSQFFTMKDGSVLSSLIMTKNRIKEQQKIFS